mgnify:CR=1 FL=1
MVFIAEKIPYQDFFLPGLAEALALAPGGLIAIVGGGGKTSLMYALAEEARAQGRRALISTTTHIRPPEAYPLIKGDPALAAAAWARGEIPCAALPGPEGRLTGPGEAALARLKALAEWLIVEADGSKGLPMKAPAAWEPVLPAGWDKLVAVAGLSALGQPLNQVCHRPELAAPLLGVGQTALVTPELMAGLLLSPAGQMKGADTEERYRILLNQADAADPGPLLAILKARAPEVPVAAVSLRQRRLVYPA